RVKASVPDSGFDVSEKAKYALGAGFSLNRYSVFMVVKTKVKNETKLMSHARLADAGMQALRPDPQCAPGIDNFRLRCGADYMAGYTRGGEYGAVLEIETESDDEKAELSAQLEGSANIAGLGELGTEQGVGAKLKRAAESGKLRIWSQQTGGLGGSSAPS